MNIDKAALFIILTTVLLLSIVSNWRGEYVVKDIYKYSTERQCLIDDEWTDVDSYLIQWGTDWYKIDDKKTLVSGRTLQCSKERVEIYIETKEVYNPGFKDIIMFWKWVD